MSTAGKIVRGVTASAVLAVSLLGAAVAPAQASGEQLIYFHGSYKTYSEAKSTQREFESNCARHPEGGYMSQNEIYRQGLGAWVLTMECKKR